MYKISGLRGGVEKEYVYWMLLGLCTAAALWLRIIDLGAYDLQFDEVASLVSTDFSTLLSVSANKPTFRPFFMYNVFLSLWYSWIGGTEFMLRISSVLFGAGAVCGIALAAGKLFDRKTALFAAFLLCISPFHIHYSQELTIYSATLFFSTFSTYFLLRFRRSLSYVDAGCMLAANLVGVYINHTAFLITAVQISYLLACKKDSRKAVKAALIAVFLHAAVLLPWAFIMLKQFMFMLNYTRRDWQVVPFLPHISPLHLLYTLKNFSSGYYAPDPVRAAATALLAGLCLFSLYLLRREREKDLSLLFWSLVFPPLFLAVFSGFLLMYADRYVISSLVFFYILAAYGMLRLKPVLRAAAFAAAAVFSLLSLNYYYAGAMETQYRERPGVCLRKEFKKAALYLAGHYEEGDIVFHLCETSTWPMRYYILGGEKSPAGIKMSRNMADFMVDYYFKDRGCIKFIEYDIKHDLFRVHLGGPRPGREEPDIFARGKRIWVVYSAWEWLSWRSSPFSQELTGWLLRKYEPVETRDYRGIRICLFERIRADIPDTGG